MLVVLVVLAAGLGGVLGAVALAGQAKQRAKALKCRPALGLQRLCLPEYGQLTVPRLAWSRCSSLKGAADGFA